MNDSPPLSSASPAGAAMAAGFRTPRWVPHVLSISGIALMLALSVWQLQRLQWKEGLMKQAYEASRQPETNLDTTQDARSLEALEFRPVRVEGEFVPGKEYHLGGRYLNGKQGYSILAPLRIAPGLPLLMVERGWVPADRKLPQNRPESIPAGKVTVHGVVHLPSRARAFTPDNRPDRNFWFWTDLASFAADLGEPLAPVLVLATEKNAMPGQLPIPSVNGIPELRNDHLGYALTWLMLSLGIGAMYALWLTRERAAARRVT